MLIFEISPSFLRTSESVLTPIVCQLADLLPAKPLNWLEAENDTIRLSSCQTTVQLFRQQIQV